MIPIDKLREVNYISDLTCKSNVDSKTDKFKRKQTVIYALDYVIDEYGAKYAILPFYYSLKLKLFHYLPNDDRVYPQKKVKFEGKLLQRQVDISQEIFDMLNKYRCGILSLYTGFGKTIMAIYISCILGYKVLILTHFITVMDQWEYSIKKVCPTAKVQLVTGSDPLDPDANFYIINPIVLLKREMGEFSSIGLLIADEVHLLITEKMSEALLRVIPRYSIGLSATPFRSDGLDQMLTYYYGDNIVERKMKRYFKVYKVETGFVPYFTHNNDGTLNWESVLKSQGDNDARNQLIIKILSYFKRDFLISCKRKKHTELLLQMAKDKGESADKFIASQRKFDFNCRLLFSTYSKTGVGFDHPNLTAWLVAADVKEGIQQYMGRIFRKDDSEPIIFDLVDDFKPLNNHWLTRRRTYIEAGGEIFNFFNEFPEFVADSKKIKSELKTTKKEDEIEIILE